MSKCEQYCWKCNFMTIFTFGSEDNKWGCDTCGTNYDGRKARHKEEKIFLGRDLVQIEDEIKKLTEKKKIILGKLNINKENDNKS